VKILAKTTANNMYPPLKRLPNSNINFVLRTFLLRTTVEKATCQQISLHASIFLNFSFQKFENIYELPHSIGIIGELLHNIK
jgi:hypothetical protein